MAPATPRILYIVGSGRSGTTLLGKMLNEMEGVFFGGELRFVWEQYADGRSRCACGKAQAACEFWAEVLALWQALSSSEERTAARTPLDMIELQASVFQRRHLFAILRKGDRAMRGQPALTKYVMGMQRLYQAIAQVSGAKVIVDSSKRPIDTAIASLAGNIYFVHLIRDPRGVMFSREKRRMRVRAMKGKSEQVGALSLALRYAINTIQWDVRNVFVAWMARRLAQPRHTQRSHYEDLIAQPERTLYGIVDMLQMDSCNLPSLHDNSVDFSQSHIAHGNRMRFTVGPTPLREDRAWEQGLNRNQRRLIELLAWPLMRRYEY
ncbi:MAG: sulfotransferase [Caldilineales bacterium]|nr:sulfotransferase [Caldilineales bacterium]